MAKLVVCNHLSLLTGTPAEICRVKEALSYPDKARMYAYKKVTGKYKEFRKYLTWEEGDKLIFASGHLDRVCNMIQTDVTDKRAVPQGNVYFRKHNAPKLRDYQEKCVENCLKDNRGIIEASTGSGKSVMAAELIYRLKQPTLIIVPTINILKQFYGRLEGMFTPGCVGMIGGGKTQINKDIVVATFQSLLKIEPKHFNRFKALIIDEAQHCSADTIQEICKTRTSTMYYRYYFSATPYRADGSDLALEGVIGSKRLFRYGFEEGSQKASIVSPKFIIFDYEHSIDADYKKNDFLKEYTALVADNEDYNKFVAQTVIDAKKKGRHIIIFVKHIAQGELLMQNLPGSVLITGLEKPQDSQKILNDFRDKKFDILIGTSVIGEGVDIPSADCGVMAGGGKSKVEVIQKIGRLLRPFKGKKDAWIIDFTHRNAPFSERHSKIRQNIYQKEYPATKMYFV